MKPDNYNVILRVLDVDGYETGISHRGPKIDSQHLVDQAVRSILDRYGVHVTHTLTYPTGSFHRVDNGELFARITFWRGQDQ
ncbi:hypothetical protein MAHJHV61_39630 [Mycobacterium avium subsp. hominissuis]|uniref:Uncharacterized protein n=1 Tax=Mycobacterium kyorinense TaxID=487514 RepID=A0A1X1Y181_9MYCO|nr:hypothetical protein AWC14_02355 [Mycobacterium kyorinense]